MSDQKPLIALEAGLDGKSLVTISHISERFVMSVSTPFLNADTDIDHEAAWRLLDFLERELFCAKE